MFSYLIIVVLLQNVCNAHVVLTFPKARWPPLDFLDSVRIEGPCGVKRPFNAQFTSLISGEKYHVTWHMAYPHQGGYKLSILDKNGRKLRTLVGGDNKFVGSKNSTIQSHSIQIPRDLQCSECILQLERQAIEWGKNYWFWSCADINVLSSSASTAIKMNECMGNGYLYYGECVCDRYYHGDMCQYKEDCWQDEDCMWRGVCSDLGTRSYPRKVCFCDPPYYGKRCEKEFVPTHTKDIMSICFDYGFYRNVDKNKFKYGLFDPNCYKKQQLNPTDTIYWRKVEEEIEIVLEYKSKSWIAVGWKPLGLSTSCRNIDFQIPQPEVVPEYEPGPPLPYKATLKPRPEPKSEPETSNAEPTPEPEKLRNDFRRWRHLQKRDVAANYGNVYPEPKAEPEPNSEPKAEPETKYEPKVEPESKSEPKSEPRAETEPKAEAEPKAETEPKAEAEPEPGAEAEPEPEPRAEAEPKAEPEAEGEPKAEPEPGAETEPKAEPNAEPEPKGKTEPEPEGESSGSQALHPMDCADIVVGGTRGECCRAGDYFTRDRSTPLTDWSYGGKDDLTAVFGKEIGDKSILMFRKPVKAQDKADHSLTGRMMVIWAKGQEHGNYGHSPSSGIETSIYGDKQFYKRDELKYHGISNRGITVIDFSE